MRLHDHHASVNHRPMLDWNDLRLAVVLARERTLTRTARALGLSQPTASRRLTAIEGALGTKLFLKSAKGYTPTRAGQTLLSTAQDLELAIGRLERGALADDDRLEGVVRVAVTEVTALHLLEEVVPRLRRMHASIVIELVGASTQASLDRGEADLAVRMVQPEGAELRARSLGRMRYGLYGSRHYLEQRGEPGPGLGGHAIVQPIGILTTGPEASWLATHAQGAEVALRTSSMLCMAMAARQGVGLAMLPTPLAHLSGGLVEVSSVETPLARTAWLVMHRDVRQLRRVRVVADEIATDLRARIARR
jgi:DNA-binding transcriptional LysR family regulator